MRTLAIVLCLVLGAVPAIAGAEKSSPGVEIPLVCATAISVAMGNVSKEKDTNLQEDFDRVFCVERDGGVEVAFNRKNRQLRGGGIHYELSGDGKTILKVRHTR